MTVNLVVVFILAANTILSVSSVERSIDFPQLFNPTSYRLDLHLPHEIFTSNDTIFSGKVKINFTFIRQINYVTLYSSHRFIKITNITFDDVLINKQSYFHDRSKDEDILTIYLNKEIKIGTEYELIFEYNGIINRIAKNGLYRNNYVDEYKRNNYILATQLSSSYARTVFPCFDDPRMKAIFHVSITLPTYLNVIFNTAKQTKILDDDMAKVIFRPTPRMSTYLLAFIVSEFTCSTGVVSDRVPFRVCSREILEPKRDFVLEVTTKLLAGFNNFTGYNYSRIIGKLDIVALPKSDQPDDSLMVIPRETEMFNYIMVVLPYFLPAVTEPWGVMMRKESELLYDVTDSPDQKQAITLAVSHELSDQWFGNLITFNWWSDIFINKGLTAFFETYITNEAFPEWEVEKQFVVNHLHEVLVHDAFSNVRSLYYDKKDTTSISVEGSFSQMSYYKGGAIIRMVQHFMGLDNFRRAIRNYINKHKFGVVDRNDLWRAMDEIIVKSVPGVPANLSIVMESWLSHTGYPVLYATSSKGLITVSQMKFLYFSYQAPNGIPRQYVPISYTSSNQENKFNKTSPDIWLTPKDKNISFSKIGAWTILNNQQTGYYRVCYDTTLMEAIRLALEKDDFDGITEINRAHLVDDLFNLARASILRYKDVLKFIKFLKKDTSYYSWKAATGGFRILLTRFGYATVIGKEIVKDMLDLIDNMYNSVPISIIKEDDRIYSLKQQLALEWACRLGHKGCVKEVSDMFKSFANNGTRLKARLRYVVYCNGLRHSDNHYDWKLLSDNLYIHEDPSHQKTIRSALVCTRNTSLLKRYLRHSISNSTGFNFIDVMMAFIQSDDNPEAAKVAFDFLLENQEHILRTYVPGRVVQYLFAEIGGRMELSKLENLTKKDSDVILGFRESAKTAYQAAAATNKWLDAYRDELIAYYNIVDYTVHYGVGITISLIFVLAVIICLCVKYRKRIYQFVLWLQGSTPSEPDENIEMDNM